MKRLLIAFVAVCCIACGLADNPRDEQNKTDYITFADPVFGQFCLENFDSNGDARISRYEAQRVREMDCSGLGIKWLWEIGEFSNLRTLDCSGNALTELDVHNCTSLTRIDCSENRLTAIDIDGVAGLAELDCADNMLPALELSYGSIAQFDGRGNRFVTLDFRRCSASLEADVRENPTLTTLYALLAQRITADGTADILFR